MMDQSYSMAVRISLSTAGLPGQVGTVIALFQRLQKAANAAAAGSTKAAIALQNMGRLLTGAALFAGGMAGVNVMKGWVSSAAQFQSAMMGVQLATHGTRAEFDRLQASMFAIAGHTQFSAGQIATMAKVAATAGLNNRAALLAALPTLANVAEVDYRLKGIAPEQSVAASVQMAHLFQSYGGAGFQRLLDLAGRAQLVSGMTPDQMVRTLAYLAPARAAYHMSPDDLIATAALASNVGLTGGRGGGSRLMAMFREIATTMGRVGSALTGHNAAIATIERLGHGTFFTRSGAFAGVANMLEVVMRAMTSPTLRTNAQERMSLLKAAFLSAGMTGMATLATPAAVARFQSIERLLGPGGLLHTDTMQQRLNATFSGQLTTLHTNLSSLGIMLGTQLLPPLTALVKLLVQVTSALIAFGQQHPWIVTIIADFTMLVTTLGLARGAFLMVTAALNLLGITGASRGFISLVGFFARRPWARARWVR